MAAEKLYNVRIYETDPALRKEFLVAFKKFQAGIPGRGFKQMDVLTEEREDGSLRLVAIIPVTSREQVRTALNEPWMPDLAPFVTLMQSLVMQLDLELGLSPALLGTIAK
jgi:hypothetical protein